MWFGGGSGWGTQQQNQQQQSQQQQQTQQQQAGSLFGSSGFQPTQSIFGTSSQPTNVQSSLFGSQQQQPSQQQLQNAFPGTSGLGLKSPFGLDLQTAPQATQLQILKEQLFAYGIDVNHLPDSLQAVLPRIGNPNIRTLQLLVHLIGRMVNIHQRRENDPEMICFVFSKAPSADLASRYQQLCEQRISQLGAGAMQRLMRAKKQSPEPRTHYFTTPLFGFKGLQERVRSSALLQSISVDHQVKEQAAFFEHFACSLKELQTRQKNAHDGFRGRALDRLQAIRARQADLRHRLISLVGALDELASRAQNFEGDEQEIAQIEQEYERTQKQLTSAPASLQRCIPVIKERLKAARAALAMKDGSETEGLISFAAATKGSKSATTHAELLPIAESHHESLESIKQRLHMLSGEIQNMLESAT